jgi:Fur family zinc uptake transcriptional regulator
MKIPSMLGNFPAPKHNHQHCMATALADAENSCRRQGIRLTSIRRRILAMIWQEHRPIKAYELLDILRQEGMRAAPPTVYRALEFLLQARLIHRIETLNAFIGCPSPHVQHTGQFLICQRCGTVAELEDARIRLAIQSQAEHLGFQIDQHTIEVRGLCAHCASATP